MKEIKIPTVSIVSNNPHIYKFVHIFRLNLFPSKLKSLFSSSISHVQTDSVFESTPNKSLSSVAPDLNPSLISLISSVS